MIGLFFLVALGVWIGAILSALYRDTIYRFWIFFRGKLTRFIVWLKVNLVFEPYTTGLHNT
jgi:hypothetical protein